MGWALTANRSARRGTWVRKARYRESSQPWSHQGLHYLRHQYLFPLPAAPPKAIKMKLIAVALAFLAATVTDADSRKGCRNIQLCYDCRGWNDGMCEDPNDPW